MALEQQTYTTSIRADPAACFAVITDFDAYPQWSSAVRRTRVLEHHPDGLAKRVEMELDITIRRIRYVLEYRYEPPGRLTWKMAEGDLRGVEGVYTFEPAGPGRTQVTCSQAVDVGFWIPGFLRHTFEQHALRTSVEEFRQAVETRHPAG
jgi:ribosome-associated toxin RatA of RatAB toxin-antitoxin module